MERNFITSLSQNFDGAMDMFKYILELCPDYLWEKQDKFYYLSYHTIIFLDYYLSQPVSSFQPLLPYTITNAPLPVDAIDDVLPDKLYSRAEMLTYLSLIKGKAVSVISPLDIGKFSQRWITDIEIPVHGLCPGVVENYTLLEILFYNLRHLQHHIGQLNLLLRQRAHLAAEWQ